MGIIKTIETYKFDANEIKIGDRVYLVFRVGSTCDIYPELRTYGVVQNFHEDVITVSGDDADTYTLRINRMVNKEHLIEVVETRETMAIYEKVEGLVDALDEYFTINNNNVALRDVEEDINRVLRLYSKDFAERGCR